MLMGQASREALEGRFRGRLGCRAPVLLRAGYGQRRKGGREERRISECLVGCTFISWYRAHWVRRREEEWASV